MKTLIAALLLAGPCFGADLGLNLDQSVQSGNPGDTLSFSGSLFNAGSNYIDLNSIQITLGGTLAYDSGPFFAGPATLPDFSQSDFGNGILPFADFLLFTVSVPDPYTDASGPVLGTVTILGGVETSGYDTTLLEDLASANFEVDVTAPVTPPADTPEPSSRFLLFAGCGALRCVRHATLRNHAKSRRA